MHLVTGHTEVVWRWAAKFFAPGLERPDWAFGIVDSAGVLRGAILGNQYNIRTAEVTFCGNRAFTPGVIKDFFRLYFLRYWRMQISTARTNTTIKRNAIKWGFKFEGVATDFYGTGCDALRYSMIKTTCRWIKGRDDDGNKQLVRRGQKGAHVNTGAGGRRAHHRAAAKAKHGKCAAAGSLQST